MGHYKVALGGLPPRFTAVPLSVEAAAAEEAALQTVRLSPRAPRNRSIYVWPEIGRECLEAG